MQTSATRYLSWLTETAAMAQCTGLQAQMAASAFEAAFAATVPPMAVIANRTELATLLATNILGQNTPMIMANEAMYAEMWAQDATAMYGYQASSAVATAALPQFTPAPQTTTGAEPSGVTPSWLTTPNAFLTALADPSTPVGFVEAQGLAFSSSGPWQAPLSLLTYALMGQANGYMDRSNSLTEEGNRISQELALDDEMQLGHTPGGAGYLVNPAEAPTMPENSPRTPMMHPSASMGDAHTAGNLSVPPAWRNVELASKATPLSGGMIPTPIAAVNTPKRERKKGEDVLQVKLILPKGI